MQWQHGTFEKASDGKLHLTPFGDGRQLLSDPCNYDKGVYTKYDQNITFKVWLSTMWLDTSSRVSMH